MGNVINENTITKDKLNFHDSLLESRDSKYERLLEEKKLLKNENKKLKKFIKNSPHFKYVSDDEDSPVENEEGNAK